MFKRISHSIALQFTVFVFLLFLVNGAVFLLADFRRAQTMTHVRLQRLQNAITSNFQPDDDVTLPPRGVPPTARERVRIVDMRGNVLYGSDFFDDIPLPTEPGFSQATVGNEQFTILTAPLERQGKIQAYAQIAEMERQPQNDLLNRAFLYLLLSAAVSALTFGVGLFFARRSLKPAEQMVERLEQFTQDASHELRTPLAALNSSLDLALKTKEYRVGILSAKADVQSISVLVKRLLELARLDRFVLASSPVDFSAIVAGSMEKFRLPAKEKSIVLAPDIADGVRVTGDALLIRQILANLLSNAIKFSHPKGGEKIHIRLTSHALTVKDAGIGIAPGELPHIFDRFYQADSSRAHGGYGLGLALVKRIVDLHGWKIDVKSTEGEGTTFTVSFS